MTFGKSVIKRVFFTKNKEYQELFREGIYLHKTDGAWSQKIN